MNITHSIASASLRMCTIVFLLIPVTAQPVTKKEQVMSSPSATQPTLDVVVTRVFDAPVEEVWKAWTDSEKVMRWWGPTGFTAPVARIDEARHRQPPARPRDSAEQDGSHLPAFLLRPVRGKA